MVRMNACSVLLGGENHVQVSSGKQCGFFLFVFVKHPSLCVCVLVVISCHLVSSIATSRKNLLYSKGTEGKKGKKRRAFMDLQAVEVCYVCVMCCRQK